MSLQRWIADEDIRPPRLQIVNGRATRLWDAEDVERLRQLKEKIYCRGPWAQEGTKYRPVNVAIYVRVSTMNGQDPEMQLRELREYCQRRGWDVWNAGVAGEYVDRVSVAVLKWWEEVRSLPLSRPPPVHRGEREKRP